MERIILFTALVFCTTLFLFTHAVHAWQAYDPAIHQRMGHQEYRINRGIASGRLTAGETARLTDIQARIRTEEMIMKSDGKLTGRERLRLHHELNYSSRAIHHMKHNGLFAHYIVPPIRGEHQYPHSPGHSALDGPGSPWIFPSILP